MHSELMQLYHLYDKDFPKPEILEAYLADRQLLIAVTWVCF